jgi:hypothetical protein
MDATVIRRGAVVCRRNTVVPLTAALRATLYASDEQRAAMRAQRRRVRGSPNCRLM